MSSALQECCSALNMLYHHPDSAVKAQANAWLTNFQKRAVAWQVADAILQRPGLPVEVYYYATNTLRRKLQWDFQDLPNTESRRSFRLSLLAHLCRFHNQPMVRVGLAGCMGALTLYLIADNEWPEWYREVVEICSGPQRALLLMDVLTGLPEELGNRRSCARSEQRKRVREVYAKAFPHVSLLLNSYFNANGVHLELQVRALKCLTAWIRLGVGHSDLLTNPLVDKSLGELAGSEGLCEAACDLIAEVLQQCRDVKLPPSFVVAMISRVLALGPLYDRATKEGNDEMARKLCVVFVSLSDCYMEFICQGSPAALQTVALLLNCTGHPVKEIATNTLPFWFTLASAVSQARRGRGGQSPNVNGDDAHFPAPPPIMMPERIPLFLPCFAALVDRLKGIMEFSEQFEKCAPDHKDEEKRYRYLAAEALLDVASVLGTDFCLKHIFRSIYVEANKWTLNNSDWRGLEACLYSVRSIARKVTGAELEVIPKIMELLPRFTTNPHLRYTATLIVGRYAEWISKHGQYLGPLLAFAVQGLNLKEVISSSALAFKHVCEACSAQLGVQFLEAIFQVYQQSNLLPLQDQKEVIEGVAFVVVALPLDKVSAGVERLVVPYARDIIQGLSPTSKGDGDVHLALARLAEVFRCLDPVFSLANYDAPDRERREDEVSRSVAEMVKKLWNLLGQVLERFTSEEKKMEKLCRCWKYSMKAAGGYFTPLLPPLLHHLTSLFPRFPNSSFLYTISVAVDMYAPSQPLQGVLVGAFQSMSGAVLPRLSNHDRFVQQPEIVEDYFELVARFIKKMPGFLGNPILQNVFECGLNGLHLHHQRSCTAVLQFYVLLLQAGVDHPKLNKQRNNQGPEPAAVATVQLALQKHGERLTLEIIRALAGALPADRVKFVLPLFESFLSFAKEQARPWIINAMASLPSTRNPTKEEVMVSLFAPHPRGVGYRGVRDLMASWSDACRRHFET